MKMSMIMCGLFETEMEYIKKGTKQCLSIWIICPNLGETLLSSEQQINITLKKGLTWFHEELINCSHATSSYIGQNSRSNLGGGLCSSELVIQNVIVYFMYLLLACHGWNIYLYL